MRALGALPSPDLDALVGMAEDPAEEVRLAMLETAVWSSESLLRSNPLRSDPSVRVRTALAVSLARFKGSGTKTALKIVTSLLEDPSAAVRAAALATLMDSGDPAGLQEFLRVWPKTPLDVRFELRAEPRVAVVTERLVTSSLSHPDVAVRRAAVTALGALGLAGIEERLGPALKDPSPEVRIATIHALASLETTAARALIAAMSSDPDSGVRDVARRSTLRTVK